MQLGSCMSADRLHWPASSTPLPAEVVSSVTGPKPFSVIVDQRHPGVVAVFVVGEIDSLTEAPLRNQLGRVLATGPERLVIDLSHVSFLGARGLSVLISARHTAADQGTAVELSPPIVQWRLGHWR